MTLQEIATSLDVSTATVSRALNGKPGVSAPVREKVIELANQLRYTPNPAAQNLATAKSYAVALAIRRRLVHMDNPFYDRVMMGIEMELEKQGYYLVMITIDEAQHEHGWLPPGLDPRRLDGLIIVGPELSGRTMTTLLSLGLPTVLVGQFAGSHLCGCRDVEKPRRGVRRHPAPDRPRAQPDRLFERPVRLVADSGATSWVQRSHAGASLATHS